MYSVINENLNNDLELQSIHKRLEEIRLYLEKEVALKQETIEGQKEKITDLKTSLIEKDANVIRLQTQLEECRKTNEGTRQLINKLLQDINNYQKDIDWYKRTYVKRSLAGTIWQKLFRK